MKASPPSIESIIIAQLFAGITAEAVLILSFVPLKNDINSLKKNMQITRTPQWFILPLLTLTKLKNITNAKIKTVEIVLGTLEKYNLNILFSSFLYHFNFKAFLLKSMLDSYPLSCSV
jgi:hypothetical protein